jgi:hypothetical protein
MLPGRGEFEVLQVDRGPPAPAVDLCQICGQNKEYHLAHTVYDHTFTSMTEPVQRTGERQHSQRRSRSKARQIVEVMTLLSVAQDNYRKGLRDDELPIEPLVEIVRLADKLRELIRIPR